MPLLGLPASAPTGPNAPDWLGFGLTWTDYMGNVFDLNDPSGGIVLSPAGVQGLSMPPYTRFTVTSPALAGSRYQGSQVNERPVFWPIFVYSSVNSGEWRSRDSSFWAGLRPDQVGTWTVTTPDGNSRWLTCRYTDDGNEAYTIDPMLTGWSVYAVNLVAEQPFWASTPIVRTFKAASSVDFFESSGGVFFISPGGTTASAFIPNPGDVEAWPIWTITDVSGATLGAGGGSVVVPAVSSGDLWTIDTHPDQMTVTDSTGGDHSGAVTWNPLPVPPGDEVELDITLDSPGASASVTVELDPLWYRAW